jgi:hypothetical protein
MIADSKAPLQFALYHKSEPSPSSLGGPLFLPGLGFYLLGYLARLGYAAVRITFWIQVSKR